MPDMPTAEIVRILRRTPRTAKFAHEIDALRAAGDTIVVNEGDFVILTMVLADAAALIEASTERDAPLEADRPSLAEWTDLVRRERTLELLLRSAAEWLPHVDRRYEGMAILEGLKRRIDDALPPPCVGT